MRVSPPRTFADLPDAIAVFPLPGILLLPRGRLPLNIFEPRYLAMTLDALADRQRLIGMIQPIDPGVVATAPEPRPPALHATGCAGRISSFSETDDGRYLITLTGVCRFNVVEEIATTGGYRRVVADFSAWAADLADESDAPFDRSRLMAGLNAYFAASEISADMQAIAATPNARLVTTLAMICPFDPQEKQALLEARTVPERARLLMALMDMAAAGHGHDSVRH